MFQHMRVNGLLNVDKFIGFNSTGIYSKHHTFTIYSDRTWQHMAEWRLVPVRSLKLSNAEPS